MRNKIRNPKGKNPREYWRILKDKNSKDDYNEINIEELYTFFKSQNKDSQESDTNTIQPELNTPDLDTSRLNGDITYDEVLSAINKTKSNKSCGHDNIFNEYIKSTKLLMIPIYVKLFNVIFNLGIDPEG